MNISTIGILAFLGSFGAFIMSVYTFVLFINIKKMQKKNQEFSSYIKECTFLLMKNGGNDPCDIQKKLVAPKLSQECDYIVRR